MSIDIATTKKVAKLARLKLKDEKEAEEYTAKLNGILGWIEQLQQVNTDDVPALASVSDTKLPWRKDSVTDGHKREAVLANAPKSEYECYAVPKVIE